MNNESRLGAQKQPKQNRFEKKNYKVTGGPRDVISRMDVWKRNCISLKTLKISPSKGVIPKFI
jgi:hypothetical protein